MLTFHRLNCSFNLSGERKCVFLLKFCIFLNFLIKPYRYFCVRRFLYYFWNEWFKDVPSVEMFREISGSTNSSGITSENVIRMSRRCSPSIIPSLFELASGSFKLLREFNSGFIPRTLGTEQCEDGTLPPLSTPSEVRFCNSVIAECTGPDRVVQERCASNYKQWILLRSKQSQLDCNSATPNTCSAGIWSSRVSGYEVEIGCFWKN